MRGDALDIVILAVCATSALSGYRQGFIRGALSFAGIFGGGLLGTRVAIPVVHHFRNQVSAPLLGVVAVFALAALGQALAATAGVFLRHQLRFRPLRPLRVVDNTAGAVLSVVAVLLVAWLVGTSVAHSSLTGVSRQIRRSAVIAAVDGSIPDGSRDMLDQFRRLLDNTGFPAVLDPLTSEAGRSVPAPDPAVLASPAVVAARASVLKITGNANSCSRSVEGSGFVYARNRVLTNAHVVAGVETPEVLVDGVRRRATVVVYDPDRDLAVLAVDTGKLGALTFGGVAAQGGDAVVAGYPEDGPFTAVAARIRDRREISGPNIYQSRTVDREVYTIRAVVLPGNSGGPLLTPTGSVYGVVFAASTDVNNTGYVLTAEEIAADATAGAAASAPVSSQRCD